MFDISFTELLVIGSVALIVIGPEKLPKVARTAGFFAGKLQKMVAQVKDEVNREVRFEELQKLQREVEGAASTIKTNVNDGVQAFKSEAETILDPQKAVKEPVTKVAEKNSTTSTAVNKSVKSKTTSRKSTVKAAAKSENVSDTTKTTTVKKTVAAKKAVS